MITRVSSYFQNQNSLRSVQIANEGLAKTTYQITTGNKAERLSDIAGVSSQIVTLQNAVDRIDVYKDNMTTATNRLNSAENALAGMKDLLAEAASVATLGRNENTASTRSALAPKAQAIADTFYNLFKTQFEGHYIFSGMKGDTSPVATNAAATAFPGAPIPTTWYQGDSTPPSVMTGPGTTLQYGLAGNETAFAEMKAGFEALWYGLQNNSLTDIDSAITTLKSAQTDLAVLQGRVGGQINTLQQLDTRYDNQKQFTTQQLDGLQKADISEAITMFTQQQTTLQASLQIIAKINSISLLDYVNF